MARLYNMDIVKCEDVLYESLDALVEYAKTYPEEFITYTKNTAEVTDVKINDNGDLQIDYLLEDYDENDNEIQVAKSEFFSYEWTDMMTLVA